MKKIIVFFVISLFIGTAIVPVTGELNKLKSKTVLLEKDNEFGFRDIVFDLIMNLLMKIGHFPSLSACIINDDAIIWSKGYGFDLDDDVNDYLPFSLRNPSFPDDSITFRMLLSHQSSLAEDPLEFYQLSYTFGEDSPVALYPFLETYLVPGGSNYSSDVWSTDPPGERFHYANIGFALIGYLVEQISGKPFDQYCKDNIFLPLKMYNTSYRLSDIDIEQLAIPYDFNNGEYIEFEHYGYIDYPAGSVRTSISELSHFLIAHMNGGVYKNVLLLDEDTVNLMHTIHYSNSNYGLGWGIVNSSDGDKFIGHEGGDFGVITSMYIRISDNVSVIIFVNVSPWTMNTRIWYLMRNILFLKANSIINMRKNLNFGKNIFSVLSHMENNYFAKLYISR
jgi:CubicO group peptidase (beta-lactamase class C family)